MSLETYIVTLAVIVILIFVVPILRGLANLSNDSMGYQMNILSTGTLVSIITAPVLGNNFWPSYPFEHLDKAVALFTLVVIQIIFLLFSIILEKKIKSGNKSKLFGKMFSIILSVFPMSVILLSSASWS